MITRSLSHHGLRLALPRGQRRSPVAGPRHTGAFPLRGAARHPGPFDAREASFGGEQAEGATQANNYWSATTNAGNPNNAWNVNFNNGNVNNDNKTNNNYVRAVRGGLWSLGTTCVRSEQVTALCRGGGGEPQTAFRRHVPDVRLH